MEEIGQVKPVDIDSEMRAAYLDYAMSVIVSRALPDARDGLKPVHRRILYAMHDMGLNADSPYRKSARIVGEVLGKYHPHGDQAVYDSMVRMAQDFSMRYPLVDGQGNFGSIDGDNAAAMRYTEARMYTLGVDMLTDIQKDTVDFGENFDGSLLEPSVLPSSVPNLLVNGAAGIAVGMSTSVPPHNMGEVCDALNYMLDHWDNLDDVGLPELMQFIKGPDFPTGGLIFRYDSKGDDRLVNSYASGRGRLTVQARAHIEQMSRNRSRIIITELPYTSNKTNLIEKIATLVRDGKLEGITDLRDESDRQGLRIVIDLTRTADGEEVLEYLYKRTPMRMTFSVIMLALVDGEPRMLSLKQALRVFIEHRLEVIRRRSEHDLERARERAHILEGYITALDNLDEVIETIRRSRTVQSARNNLMRSFNLSEVQAQAILDMPLRRLAAMERRKIEEEYAEKQELIEYLTNLLEDPAAMRAVIKEELAELRERYDDPRRTLILDSEPGAVRMSEILPDEETWVVLTEGGRLARTLDTSTPRVTAAIPDPPRSLSMAVASDTLYLFAADGEAVSAAVHQLPREESFTDGPPVSSYTRFNPGRDIVTILPIPPGLEEGYLVLASSDGMVKRIELEDLPGLSANAFTVLKLNDPGERLVDAALTTGSDEIILVSAKGKAIRFEESEVRPMGLTAAGVRGIKLNGEDDAVVGMLIAEPETHVWVITEDGEAKSSPIEDYPVQGRYGQGVLTIKRKKSQRLAAAALGYPDDPLIVATDKGKPKYMRLGYAPHAGRNTPGTSIIALGSNEKVRYVVRYQSRNGFV